MKPLLLLLLLPALSSAANITTTTCTPTVTTGCHTLDLSTSPTAKSALLTVSGTWVGALVFEGATTSSGTYTEVRGYPAVGSYATTTTGNGTWLLTASGFTFIRVRASTLNSGTAVVVLQPSSDTVVPDVMRVVGSTFGPVDTTGTISLSSNTLGALGTATCTQAEAHRLSLTTTPIVIPTEPPIAGRTSWTVINVDATKRVSCRVDPGDGGVPNCTTPGFGLTAFPNGGSITFPVRESDTVRCVACTTGAEIEHTEEACVSP